MAKKSSKIQVVDPEKAGTLQKSPIGDIMHDSMMPYSEYIILERALPRIEDGLKPVQRRILYTMWELKNDPDKPYKKSARIVGDTMGKYHPHGDSSIYEAMVRMAQDFSMGEKLVDGHGNFGSIDGDGAAAMRYTEVRMAPISLEMLRDIEKDTVQFKYNFDDTLKEPELLPCRFPNLLVNGASGIAIGFATEIPTHNLGETIDASIYAINHPMANSKELMKYIPAPDFPTGGIIMKDISELEKVYTTGRGKIVIRSKSHIEEISATKKAIVITEFPYGLNKSKILEKIAELCEDKKSVLTNVIAIRDESDMNGIRAVIEIKKDADPDKILAYLYKYTDLQYNFAANMVAVAHGKPVRFSLADCIHYYIDFQKQVFTNKTKFELNAALKDKHIMEGLIKACSIIDEIIKTIRKSKNPSDARENLQKNFGFSKEQAQAILDLKLQRLTNLEIVTLKANYSDLCARIAEYERILGSEEALNAEIVKDLTQIKEKFATPRKSEIETSRHEKTFSEEEFIVSEDVIVVITHNQEIKSIEKGHFARSNGNLKEIEVGKGDYVEHIIHTSSDYKLTLFTDKGNCYTLAVNNIPTSKWKERGMPLTNMLTTYDRSERLISVYASKSYNEGKILFVTRNGMCKLTSFDQFMTTRSKISACDLAENDILIDIKLIKDETQVCFVTEQGMILKTDIDQISEMGRASKGVKAMKLHEGDSIVSAQVIKSKYLIIFISDGGYAKKTSEDDITLQKRAGVGLTAFKFNKNGSNGSKIVSAVATGNKNEEILILKDGADYEYINIADISELPLSSAGKSLSDWHEAVSGAIIVNEYKTRDL